jgi:predicted acyltransferase
LVDNVKGVLVLVYMLWHFFSAVAPDAFDLPVWLSHNLTGEVLAPFAVWRFFNFVMMDLGQPAFFFLIGLTLFYAFSRQVERIGKKAATLRFFNRNILIFAVGTLLTFLQNRTNGEHNDWDLFQGIGFTGILLIPFLCDFIRTRWYLRGIAGVAIIFIFHLIRPYLLIMNGAEGGVLSCFGYLGMVLLASVVLDLIKMKGGVIFIRCFRCFYSASPVLRARFSG